MNHEKLIAKAVAQMPPSGIRKFFDIVSEMKDAISLGVGEPDFVTPTGIREAAVKAIRIGETHYTSNWGLLELRQLIARYMKERCGGVEYDPRNEIIVTVGASEGIDLSLRCLINPAQGEEVLIPEPSYVSYQPEVSLAGGVARPVKTSEENCFKVTKAALGEAITERTKAIILPYPNNPTGAIMERKDLLEIAELIRGTDIVVISDEIYSELVYDGKTHNCFASLPGMRERTITLNGFSKAFAMTGWRMGYVCAPESFAAAMCKIHQYTALCAPVMGQYAALAALQEGFKTDFADVRHMRSVYDRRRRLMVKGFREMGFPCFEPFGAFYVFPNISKSGLTSEEFSHRLLKEQKVAAVPGTAFGASGEGFLRCSYATSTENVIEAISRIGTFAKNL
ncbi:MAG: aminotransferase class I/II-fold pyridoxal phosphate-dependent enzyme [Christensenellales bacterium]